MANWIKTEWEKLTAIDSGAELHRIFLRALQAIAALGFLWGMVFTVPMLFQLSAVMAGSSYLSFWLALALATPLIQVGAAEFCLRSIRAGKFRGTLVGLVLASFTLCGWMFPLAVFGFYCLLNKAYQEKYLRGAPKAFRELLSALKINRIPEDQLQAAVAPQR